MKIGFRTLKTAVGIALAVYLAYWLGLKYYTSAAIITILCIQTTRKRSYQTAWERLAASLIGMFISSIVFYMIGYNPLALSLILLLLIPICVYLNINDGIVTSTVVILHLYLEQQVTLTLIGNEIALLAIGIGIAMLLNWYMPNREKELKEYQSKIEANFRTILYEFAAFLREGKHDWAGKEIVETAELIKQAKELAVRSIENNAYNEYFYYQYFEILERQFEILVRVAAEISTLNQSGGEQELILADFLDQLANAVHPGNTVSIYLKKLDEVREKLKMLPLPTTQEEFEKQAALQHFLKEMRRYLLIKRDLYSKIRAVQNLKKNQRQWFKNAKPIARIKYK